MLRVLFEKTYGIGKKYVEISCVSTDVKPTEDILTGSILTEVDTGKVYFFDESLSTWVEQFSFIQED